MAVQIAPGEVDRGEIALGAQQLVDQADALDEFRPVDGGNEAQAGDHIAHADVHGALTLVFAMHDVIRGRALRGEPRMQPGQRRCGLRIVVAQPLKELRGERVRQRLALEAAQHRRMSGGAARISMQHGVGESVGSGALIAPRGDAGGEPAQIFDQHHAQGDGDRPQFANGERLHPLVGAAESMQGVQFEAAVGVCNQRPAEAVHPRIAAQRSARQLRQLSVIAGRQITPDRTDVRVDDVEVVLQPRSRRRHDGRVARTGVEGAVRGVQNGGVLAQSSAQRNAGGWCRDHRLVSRQGFGEMFEPLDAEQFGGNRLVSGRLSRQRTLDAARAKIIQRHLCNPADER